MNKKEVIEVLDVAHSDLFSWLKDQDSKQWVEGPEGKWTSGQHILHLVESIRMLNKALRVPKFILKKRFGIANRPLRSYDEVAQRYDERLAANLDRAEEFNRGLKVPSIKDKERLVATLQIQNKKLQYKTNKWSDAYLDTLLLPHPLMGRMIIREIIMWTAHHTRHHTEILKENY